MARKVRGRARMSVVPQFVDVLYFRENGGQVPQSDFTKVKLTLDE
jgi:hypothetical protein